MWPCQLTSTLSYGRPSFIENKRYQTKPRGIGDVVNRKDASVYQTDAVLILIDRVQRRRSDAPKN
jgi:hypothetical protein